MFLPLKGLSIAPDLNIRPLSFSTLPSNGLVIVNSNVKRNDKLVEVLKKERVEHQLFNMDFGDFAIISRQTTYIFLTEYITNIVNASKEIDSQNLRNALSQANGVVVMLIQSTSDKDETNIIQSQVIKKIEVAQEPYHKALVKLMSMNVIPIVTGDTSATMKFVVDLARAIGNGLLTNSSLSRQRVDKDMTLRQKRFYLLSVLGDDVARQVIDKYRTLDNMYRVLKSKDLAIIDFSTYKVNGKELGLKRAKKLVDILYE